MQTCIYTKEKTKVAKINAHQIAKLYAKRMQIEESFRDVKSPQYGLGLRHSNSRDTKRFDILLLIAMLEEWVLRLIGLIARQRGWDKVFQANTIRKRAVLSTIRLGREVRKRWREYRISMSDIHQAIALSTKLIQQEGMAKL
ncbi:transposase [Catenovulum sp. 2E275]|uniref:transposase n=1 Tax=Catenovulum sp. 2E275 TaxID=2980497 RepID=UPI0021CF398D|nr:transposase [Catenovulum sp. 2E275]MCU4677476.1 transposase [Catenovulum sp. 2E275]